MHKQFYIYVNKQRVKVDENISAEYYYLSRRQKYYERDIKREKIIVDNDSKKVTFIPAKEDSYDLLLEKGKGFIDSRQKSVEDIIELDIIKEAVNSELNLLPEKDRALVIALIDERKSEREIAKELGVSQNAIHKRKNRIYKKLKEKLKNFKI